MKINPQYLRELLGVSNHTLRYWRDTSRLPKGAADPHYLPAMPDDANPNVIWYRSEDVIAFIQRNERYRDKFLAAYADQNNIDDLLTPALPLARATTIAHDLRGDPLPEPSNSWWLPTEVDYPEQHQHQGESA